MMELKPIGYIETPFQFKNGTPRQPTICSQARGVIHIDKAIFNNPEHSLEGLEEYSHVWYIKHGQALFLTYKSLWCW